MRQGRETRQNKRGRDRKAAGEEREGTRYKRKSEED